MHYPGTQNRRIQFLDGLRGVAILSVVLFHAYARWTDLVPFGASYANFPLFRFGSLGVQLFFMISGFVILMTLEKCSSFKEFVARRWRRLFPAMLICSLVIFVTADFFSERPSGTPTIRDLIPGLTFIDPYWIETVTGSKQGALEGAFWTLFIEFKFYFIFGFLYFCLGTRAALISLAVIYLAGSRMMREIAIATHSEFLGSIYEFFGHFLSGGQFSWFLVGALCYLFYKSPNRSLAIWVGVSVVLALSGCKGAKLTAVCFVLALFLSAVWSGRIQKILSNRVLLFLGFISYPLYLLHENSVVAMMLKLDRLIPLPGLLLPVLPIAALMAVAWLVALSEPWMRARLQFAPARREAVA